MPVSRYIRQLQLPGFGQAAQQKLQEASVLVAGAGGLGVPILQYLTGMGIGTIGIVDGDVISLSNLHRQVLYSEQEIGRLKATVAKEKLAALNPLVDIKVCAKMLTASNALELIKPYDLVVDATDNFTARYLINDACVMLGKPFIYGAIQQFEGQVSVFNYKDGPTYRCLFPLPPAAAEIPDCNTAGVLGVVPGIIGCRQALEVVKIITGIGKNLSGNVQIFDLLNNEEYTIKLKANPANKHITSLQGNMDIVCANTVQSIAPEELHSWYCEGKNFILLDVRQPEEYISAHLQNAQSLPLPKLADNLPPLPAGMPVVACCQRGGRSSKAAAILKDKYKVPEVYDLAGGIDSWLDKIGNVRIELSLTH